MAKITVSLEVEKATYELAQGAGQFIVDMVKALGDGFQPVKDTIAIGAAAMADIIPIAGDFAQLPVEEKEDLDAFLAAWMKAGLETHKKLVQK